MRIVRKGFRVYLLCDERVTDAECALNAHLAFAASFSLHVPLWSLRQSVAALALVINSSKKTILL
jgi:hypothetical protein